MIKPKSVKMITVMEVLQIIANYVCNIQIFLYLKCTEL